MKHASQLAIFGGKPVRKKLFSAYKIIGREEKKEVKRVLGTGILSRYQGCWHQDFYGGPEVQAFEKEWAKYFKIKHAIAVNSCTSGLQAAVGAGGLGPGDEVIVSPYTMAASATAPLIYGAIPVFADVEKEYFCLDPKSIEEKITKFTKAIIVVDIFGQPYDVKAINAIAKRYNLIVIEDAAQAPGAKYDDKYAGTLGDIGVFSLNYHKHIHTGEGGIVVTNNDELAERVKLIRNHAEAVVRDKKIKDLTNLVGFNFRLTEIQAAIGRVQLRKLKSLIKGRVANCNYLAQKLSEIPGIKNATVRKNSSHVYYLQPFFYKEEIIGIPRDIFIKAVQAELPLTKLRETEGVLIECGYEKPLYLLPLFQKRIAIGRNGYPFSPKYYSGNVSYQKGICPVAESLYEKELFLSGFTNPFFTKKDLDDIVKAFKKVYCYRKELKKLIKNEKKK